MTNISDNTPVIIGVGQFSERPSDDGYRALSPMDLAGESLAAAIADCQSSGEIAAAIDTIAAIPQFEISGPAARVTFGKSDNPARSIGKRVGADPAHAILEVVGGQSPQRLVGEMAERILASDSACTAIVGSEAISTMLTHLKQGETPDWSEEIGGQLESRGYGMSGLVEKTVIANGLGNPIHFYALLENARRAKLGLSLDEYRLKMGALFAPFTQIAAANPHAAAPVERSAAELATITERNRIVAEPFPRMVVARDQVNQAAAIIVASAGKARELGVPESRWVHIHGLCNAKETPVLARPDLASSPASVASVRKALDIACVGLEDISYIDIYSCFPIAVFNIADGLGLSYDDPRGLTLTGGLPFFGGAGNNYSGHGIVEAVMRCRDDREANALVWANGGFLSKFSSAVYSCRPADWSQSRCYELAASTDTLDVLDSYSGEGVVDSYTIIPGKKGDRATIAGRTPEGARFAAMVECGDDGTLAAMREAEPIGCSIMVKADDEGRNVFRFAGQ